MRLFLCLCLCAPVVYASVLKPLLYLRNGGSGGAGAEDGEEKAVCIGLPHNVHTVPVMSVRLRVAPYYVYIFPQVM